MKYNHHYFNLDSPLISDAEYDEIKKNLIKLEEKFTYLKKYGSIKSKVGAPITNKFKKIKHSIPMLSLSNTFNADGMQDFINKVSNYLNINVKNFSITFD